MFEDKSEADKKRILEEFLRSDEVGQAALKAHLLIEGKLDDLLQAHFLHPEQVTALNLRFFQKMALARAISWTQHKNQIWNLITALNELRNQLAHSPREPIRQSKLEAVRTTYLEVFPEEADWDDAEIFLGCATYCMGFLEESRREATLAHAVVARLAKKSSQA